MKKKKRNGGGGGGAEKRDGKRVRRKKRGGWIVKKEKKGEGKGGRDMESWPLALLVLEKQLKTSLHRLFDVLGFV